MIELTCVIRDFKEKLLTLETSNKASHDRIWVTVNKHGEVISDHETRLSILEKED